LALIEFRNVDKIYDLGEVKVEALRNASLTIEKGEYVALIGASGSGKSTLMNILGSLDKPTNGTYLLAGDEVSGMSRDQRARIRNERIGFVFQNFNLLARTPAIENVELPLVYSGSTESKRLAREMLEKVGVGDRIHHHPNQLSGGQQQRVAIARALVNNPSILLADEPTGNLDSKTSQDMMQLFKELNEASGITIVLVTHERDVAQFAKRWIVLRDGNIVADTRMFDEALAALETRLS
jgi:putative ABC transport system ATP-binding protein